MKPNLLLRLLLVVASGPALRADVITTAVTLPFTPSAVDDVLSVERFDGSLGRLERAVVCVAGLVERRLAAENTSPQPAPVTFSDLRDVFRLALPGDDPRTQPLVAIEDVTAPFTATLGAFDGSLDYAGTSGIDTGLVRTSSVRELAITDSRLLARFEGTGPLDFALRADGLTRVGGPSNMEAFSQTEVAVRVVVTYEYRPFPGLR